MVTREQVEKWTILRGVVGSTVHGLNVQDGIEDLDHMGICVEPLDQVMGISAPFEQYIYRSAAERTGNKNARSQAGDLDLVIYSLRKWVRLAVGGNPTILLLLFTPQESLTVCTRDGSDLRWLAPHFISRKCQGPFLGYLQAQKQRLTGERGQKNVNRPELVEKFGYDTKYATHMLRLGYQGIELLTTGRLTLPMAEPVRTKLRLVREGGFDEQWCLTEAGLLEEQLKDLYTTSPLPDEPNIPVIEEFLRDTYLSHWTGRTWWHGIQDIQDES